MSPGSRSITASALTLARTEMGGEQAQPPISVATE
jgi:hypothetical protein